MILSMPAANSLLAANTTSTQAGLITVPAGRTFTANVLIGATVTVAGTASPRVTWTAPGTGAQPATGTIVAGISVAGLATSVGNGAVSHEIIVQAGSQACTLDFTAGAAGSSFCTITGLLI